mmetsp:Transcript_3764/g.5675  ORF Transcript_3764/g.5675 Transcript_3764/m.5675 type:complete len:336 (-) Transcript_3764:78-1085(-)
MDVSIQLQAAFGDTVEEEGRNVCAQMVRALTTELEVTDRALDPNLRSTVGRIVFILCVMFVGVNKTQPVFEDLSKMLTQRSKKKRPVSLKDKEVLLIVKRTRAEPVTTVPSDLFELVVGPRASAETVAATVGILLMLWSVYSQRRCPDVNGLNSLEKSLAIRSKAAQSLTLVDSSARPFHWFGFQTHKQLVESPALQRITNTCDLVVKNLIQEPSAGRLKNWFSVRDPKPVNPKTSVSSTTASSSVSQNQQHARNRAQSPKDGLEVLLERQARHVVAAQKRFDRKKELSQDFGLKAGSKIGAHPTAAEKSPFPSSDFLSTKEQCLDRIVFAIART